MLSGTRAHFFGVDFDARGREEDIERRGAPTTETQRKERRGESWASPKSGALRVLDEKKVGIVTSTSIRTFLFVSNFGCMLASAHALKMISAAVWLVLILIWQGRGAWLWIDC